MELFNFIRNYFNAYVGRNQEFEQLIANRDISTLISEMENKDERCLSALNEYKTSQHNIMKRQDKIKYDDKGNPTGKVEVWKLPIPYQPYINEVSLVFLYGRPVKWMQTSDNTDKAFEAFNKFVVDTSFNANIRKCKRLAGAETQCAMLFRVFKNKKGKADCQIKVLAKSQGDEIYVRWDKYDNIISFAWAYYASDGVGDTKYHVDLYTDDKVYFCKRSGMGWEVEEQINMIGKIPILLFRQEKEWDGVEWLIDRKESMISRNADVNDYFADPVAVVSAEVLTSMPSKNDDAKLITVTGDKSVKDAMGYLTWDSASESKKDELERLEKHILSKSFTPNIDFDNMKSLSNVSGKALEQMMMLANIKADKHKEVHDDLLKRFVGLAMSIIGNVLNVSLAAECERCTIVHEWQKPFGEDITDVITNLSKAVSSEIISQETAVERNPFVKDPTREIQRLQEEAEKETENNLEVQRSLFGGDTAV